MSLNITKVVNYIMKAYYNMPWLSAFIISLLGNSLPYTTIPYLVWIAFMGAQYRDILQQVSIAVFGGIGAAFGKMIVYSMGRAAHAVLPEHVKKNMEVFISMFKKWGFLAIFLFAASPLPDDILYIPLGVAGYSPILFLIAVALGKIVITSIAVFGGNILAYISGATTWFDPKFVATMLIVSALLSYLVAKINWFNVMEEARKGFIKGLVTLVREAVKAFIPRKVFARSV